MNIRAIQATECIFRTNQFSKSFGAWSFIVLEGSIEILEQVEHLYHIRLNPGAIVMHYRANETGIRFARLYHNPDEPTAKSIKPVERLKLALSQY